MASYMLQLTASHGPRQPLLGEQASITEWTKAVDDCLLVLFVYLGRIQFDMPPSERVASPSQTMLQCTTYALASG